MRKDEFPYLVDWAAASIRWLLLMGVVSTLTLAGRLSLFELLVIILAVAWNTFITVISILNRRLAFHRVINVSVDVLVSLMFFGLGGGLSGNLVWSGLLALFSAGLYFEWRGALIVGVIISLLESGWVYLSEHNLALFSTGLLAASNLAAAGVVGFLCVQLVKLLRKNYFGQVRERKNAEKLAKRDERSRLQNIYSMIEAISATLNYQEVVESVVDLSVKVLKDEGAPADQLVCAVLFFNQDDRLTVGASRRLPPRDQKAALPAKEGALAQALSSGEPQHLENPSADAELDYFVALHECRSALLLPLLRGLNAYGVMLFAHPEADYFDEDKQELLEMISHQAVVAIQNARLFQDVQEEKERIVESQEEARKKLARDLHDGPTQTVAAIAMRVNVVRKMMELNTGDPDAELEKVEELARRSTQEIRHMLFTLRPLTLEAEGLLKGLETMAEKMKSTYDQNVFLDIDESLLPGLDATRQTTIFYLVEEAVNNARKHARAEKILVRLRPHASDKEIAALEVIDNGVGFDLKEVNQSYENRGSLGMINLRERTDLVNGLLTIDSVPGKGTRVRVLVPMTEAAAERLQRGITA